LLRRVSEAPILSCQINANTMLKVFAACADFLMGSLSVETFSPAARQPPLVSPPRAGEMYEGVFDEDYYVAALRPQ
jgi:hypothetical protein